MNVLRGCGAPQFMPICRWKMVTAELKSCLAHLRIRNALPIPSTATFPSDKSPNASSLTRPAELHLLLDAGGGGCVPEVDPKSVPVPSPPVHADKTETSAIASAARNLLENTKFMKFPRPFD